MNRLAKLLIPLALSVASSVAGADVPAAVSTGVPKGGTDHARASAVRADASGDDARLARANAPATGAESLAVIVNPASGVTRLTESQAIDIFLGRYRRLPSGQAALPIDLPADSPAHDAFYQRLVHKDSAEISSYWARLVFSGQVSPPFQTSDQRTALDLVASNPNAIAYVDRRLVDRRVRVVLELHR